MEQQKYTEAVIYYKRAAGVGQDTESSFHLALAYGKMRRFGDAQTAYQAGRQLAYLPKELLPVFQKDVQARSVDMPYLNAAIYLYEGWRRASTSQHQQAIPFFQKATRLKPNLPEAQFLLGKSLQDVGRLSEAQQAFQKASTLGHGDIQEQASRALQGISTKKQ